MKTATKAFQLFKETVEPYLYPLPFKSQKGQDRWVIFEVLPWKKNGFFIELAVADGVTHSNTYVLEKLFNWTGICIEPNPKYHDLMARKRKCIIDKSVISCTSEVVDFRIDNAQLGGIVSDDTDNNRQLRNEELEEATIISLKAATLTEVLDFYEAPNFIDYLSLDVEGSEERVIRGLDLSRYSFGCVTIERPTPLVNEILFDQGYIFVKNYKYDSFYIHPHVQKIRKLRCSKFQQVHPKNW
ncbi:FkbM family methyltransferase [Synechococcales cyanobacterium C]|uniref:FkbM family methyltransferase n=1 Tax=Petrachloros mirabilis ULC683 TaxID=2781853 RepID=A0A8K2A2Q3_9CYAN|nr:FkbM family methyltransferase [Petrachloros mirabilis]NCJ08771.1 FkbM family methyltransferase [Petrachloros mirabilis ULC683]